MARGAALTLFTLAALAVTDSARAQDSTHLATLVERLDALERQNAQLAEEVRQLRDELRRVVGARDGTPAVADRLEALEEQVEVQAGRLAEHDQTKVEGSQRAPIRVTGVALFNAFYNTRHGNPVIDYPATAARARGAVNAGGSLKQSVIGLEFQAPEGVLGAQIRGSVMVDLTAATTAGARPFQVNVSSLPRVRTAWIEARWGSRTVVVGQDKLIFSPREPNSLAQVQFSPLAGAGNLYGWRPQLRFEQALKVSDRQQVRAQVAISQTLEEWPRIQDPYAATLELKRPALEGHVEFSNRFATGRRVEIGGGFHTSSTHVARTSVPSRVYSIDWLVTPHPRVELTGFWFTGKNLAKASARAMTGVTILTPRPGIIQAVPIRSRGGWAQLTLIATSRLSFNFAGGVENPDDRDLLPDMISRNQSLTANWFYRLAPNVVFGTEIAQIRTRFRGGDRPRYNHHDLYVAYLF